MRGIVLSTWARLNETLGMRPTVLSAGEKQALAFTTGAFLTFLFLLIVGKTGCA